MTDVLLLDQDPEPGDARASLDYLRLSVVRAVGAGPDASATDVRVFRARPISGAEVSATGDRVVLSFAAPHGLAPYALSTLSVLSAPQTSGTTAITTSGAHGLITGQSVLIAGATGNTAINGAWPVTVTGATTFTIAATGNSRVLPEISGWTVLK